MKDPLFTNKLAGAALVTLIFAVGVPVIIQTMETLLSGHHGDHHYEESNPFDLSYVPYEELVGGPAPAKEEVKVSLGCLLAEADPSRGQAAAALCTSCHSFDEGGGNMQGPALWNVVNRDVGGVDGYAYTSALQNFDGAWTYENLDAYLYNSQAYISGTAMAQKIGKDKKRANILAYLGTLKSGDPVPFPECEAPEEAGGIESAALGEGNGSSDG
ncbi:MAG: c-type cytochrome [Pseudomonadota bacterium]